MKRSIQALGLGTLLAMAASSHQVWSAGQEDNLQSTRETLAKWVETQQIISNEKKDWQLGRQILEQRIELIEGEIALLEGKIDEIGESLAQAERERTELLAESGALKSATEDLNDVIGPLENKTLRLLKSLPNPIRDHIRPLSVRIPEDTAVTKLSLGERFQNIIGILNEINKFNRDITVTSEIRALPGGSTAEVKALYIGLGQAYYVTPSGDAAGVGHPTPDGWEWSPADELAADISRVIAIFQNEEVPAFVPLPVTIE
jgi:hypothetical protein